MKDYERLLPEVPLLDRAHHRADLAVQVVHHGVHALAERVGDKRELIEHSSRDLQRHVHEMRSPEKEQWSPNLWLLFACHVALLHTTWLLLVQHAQDLLREKGVLEDAAPAGLRRALRFIGAAGIVGKLYRRPVVCGVDAPEIAHGVAAAHLLRLLPVILRSTASAVASAAADRL